jgi:hypothetical protein
MPSNIAQCRLSAFSVAADLVQHFFLQKAEAEHGIA